MAQTHELSPSAHKRLKAELDGLTTVGRINIARQIEVAREMGDLSENGDYHAAKEEQGKMEARIGHLSALLEDAVIIDTEADDGSVTVGSIITIRYDGDDEEERYLIGNIEEKHDDLDVMSPTSPLGESLLGATAGDAVSYEVQGSSLTVHVVDVTR
jgi:transcription elongation factor GreA